MDITELKRISDKASFNRHPWETARVAAIHFLLRKQRQTFRHILDVGSGDAFVLRTLASGNLARTYTAVDTAYSPAIISQLSELENSINIQYMQQLPTSNTNADGVLVLDVLEHCEQDAPVLAGAIDPTLTGDDAVILITVPAYQSLFSQHDKLLGHHRRYSRKRLKRLAQSEGLTIIKSGYFFFSLIPPRLFQKLFEALGWRKAKTSIDNWNGSNTVSRIISSILWADFRICHALSSIGIHLPGLSCYCLCKKSRS